MSTNIEIIIGTYEEFLLGYKLDIKNEKEVLTQSFADKSHSGSIKCLAVQGRWIATGATDDRIFIYDMKTRKQSQILLTHEGTINDIDFTPDGTHLLSGGADGRMIAVRLNTWFTEATWKKAHGGAAVTHVSCHPSGKLALSLGSDLVLRTWNLVKGRVAYKTNLKSRSTTLGSMPDCMSWSPNGDYFTLTGQRVFEIWSIKTADVLKSHKTASKPVCVCWIGDCECLVGLEDGKILWFNAVEDAAKDIAIEAHAARVKAMSFRDDILVTASSAGEVKMWRVNGKKKKLQPIACTNIGCRPTCIGILDLNQFGADYVVSKSITPKTEEKPGAEMLTTKTQERGVVTIEYENDDDTKIENNSGGDEEQNDAERNDEVADHDDDLDEENTEASDCEDAESSHAEVDEPQRRLPKSRKRKQQLLATKSEKLTKSSSKLNKSKQPKAADKNLKNKQRPRKQKKAK